MRVRSLALYLGIGFGGAMLMACQGDSVSDPAQSGSQGASAPPVESAPQTADIVQDKAPSGTGAPVAEAVADLSGTEWHLVKIQSMDDSEAVPGEGAMFSMSFQANGTVAMQVDCNRGTGSWQAEHQGQLLFGPIATTRKMCPPGSLDSRFLKELEYVRSYVLREGNLYIATMADGSILEFQPGAP